LVLLIPDYHLYENTRGFVFDNPVDYMPGQMIANYDELKNFLYTTIILKEDPFLYERNK